MVGPQFSWQTHVFLRFLLSYTSILQMLVPHYQICFHCSYNNAKMCANYDLFACAIHLSLVLLPCIDAITIITYFVLLCLKSDFPISHLFRVHLRTASAHILDLRSNEVNEHCCYQFLQLRLLLRFLQNICFELFIDFGSLVQLTKPIPSTNAHCIDSNKMDNIE